MKNLWIATTKSKTYRFMKHLTEDPEILTYDHGQCNVHFIIIINNIGMRLCYKNTNELKMIW